MIFNGLISEYREDLPIKRNHFTMNISEDDLITKRQIEIFKSSNSEDFISSTFILIWRCLLSICVKSSILMLSDEMQVLAL